MSTNIVTITATALATKLRGGVIRRFVQFLKAQIRWLNLRLSFAQGRAGAVVAERLATRSHL
jgi:hypothetical protein